MSPRRATTLLTLIAALAAPAAARADSDPASDVLLTQNAFFYTPPVSKPVGDQLTALAKEAAAAGFPVKVAMIPLAEDLGGVTDLFDQPQRYAEFLANEISFNKKQRVLVVMPAGFGTANIDPNVAAAIKGLAVDRTSADSLTRSGITALTKLAAAAGHRLAAPTGSSAPSGGTSAVVYAAPLILVVIAAGIAIMRKGREEDQEEEKRGEA